MAYFLKNKRGFYLSELMQDEIIADGVFKGLKLSNLKEENGEYNVTFTRISKNQKPIFSIKIKEPYVDEEILIDYFIDYLSKKCATKIVDFSFNNFTNKESKRLTEKDLPTSLKNTPPAFFLLYKDTLIESVNNDVASLTVKKEKTAKKYLSDNYHPNSIKEFEECVNKNFNDFFDLCDNAIWPDKSENINIDPNKGKE